MIEPENFFKLLLHNNFEFFAGVPDSTLKYLCSYIDDHAKDHIICANEGNAIAQGIGYFMATSKIPVIYLQNSGFGNILNPLLSLASEDIYNIPMLILVGWRGQPGKKDEPQHIHQGRVLEKTLKALEFNYDIMSKDIDEAKKQIDSISNKILQNRNIHFLIIEPDSFTEYKTHEIHSSSKLERKEVLQSFIEKFQDSQFLASTGFIGRELFQLREELNLNHASDFLCIGGMGHVAQIGYTFAKYSNKHTIVMDGDGSLLMHMGGLSSIQHFQNINLIHIILNNGCHLSVGGQSTVAQNLNLKSIATELGYQHSFQINNQSELQEALNNLSSLSGPIFLDIRVNTKIQKDLMRPNLSPQQMLKQFMESK